jgi:hypothetical protein
MSNLDINDVLDHVDLLDTILSYQDHYYLKSRYPPSTKRDFVVLIAASSYARRNELKFIDSKDKVTPEFMKLYANLPETQFMESVCYIDLNNDNRICINHNVRPLAIDSLLQYINVHDQPNYQNEKLNLYIDRHNSLKWYLYNKEVDHVHHIHAFETQDQMIQICIYSNYNNKTFVHTFDRVDIFTEYLSTYYPYSFTSEETLLEMESHGISRAEMEIMDNEMIEHLDDMSYNYDNIGMQDIDISIIDDKFYKSRFYKYIVDFDCSCMYAGYCGIDDFYYDNCIHYMSKLWDDKFEFEIISQKEFGFKRYQNKMKYKKKIIKI